MNRFPKSPLAIALGTAVALGATSAQASIFEVKDLPTGYMVAADSKPDSSKPQTQKSEDRNWDGHCGSRWHEGMCGARGFDMMDENHDGKVTKEEFMSRHQKMQETMCGANCDQGKCADGHCGGDWHDKMHEGKCGEGMCGHRN